MEHLPVKREDEIFPLISKAIESNVPVEVLERLFDLQQKVKADYAKEQFDIALMGFQEECPIIEKKTPGSRTASGSIAFFYARLEEIIEQVKYLLVKYRFTYTFDSVSDPESFTAICILTHINGHSRPSKCKLSILPGNKMMTETQRDSGTYTSAMRRAFCGALGIMTADVDSDSVLRSTVDPVKAALIVQIEQLITEKGLDREKQLENMKVEAFEQQTVETLTKYHQWVQKVRPITQLKVDDL